MKKTRNLILGLLLGAILCFSLGSLTGCATTGGNGTTVQDFTPAIKTAAMVGTVYSLREHPEWAPAFKTAAADLAILETAEKIDFNTILAIVLRLPVKELQSPDARLAISGATILLSGYGDKIVALEKLENLRPVAKALREGIELGLQ